MNLDEEVTTQEAAILLGVAYDTARKRLRHLTPVKKYGRNKIWTREQVESVR